MPFKRKKTKSKVQNAKARTVDGIPFRSGLEVYTYEQLKKNGIPLKYEEDVYILMQGFTPRSPVWAFLRGTFKERFTDAKPITYKPDFTCPDGRWIIEVKGFANESFPLRWKLFLRYLAESGMSPDIYMPHNRSDVDIAIKNILNSFK